MLNAVSLRIYYLKGTREDDVHQQISIWFKTILNLRKQHWTNAKKHKKVGQVNPSNPINL